MKFNRINKGLNETKLIHQETWVEYISKCVDKYKSSSINMHRISAKFTYCGEINNYYSLFL